jgi:hypothetical protein
VVEVAANDRYLSLAPSPAEERLIAAAADGEEADLRPDKGLWPPVSRGSRWGEERTVRADVIYALCLGLRPEWPVHAKGVRLRGARIAGGLDFEHANLVCPLELVGCYLPEGVDLEYATAPSLTLSGSLVTGLRAEGLTVTGCLSLDKGFTAQGRAQLLGAKIGGQLICSGGHFSNPKGKALEADNLTVRSDVFLDDGFVAHGEVRLLGAHIGGQLCCRGGLFDNPGGFALDCDRVIVGGPILLDAGDSLCVVRGDLDLRGARVGEDLVVRGVHMNGLIRAVGLQVTGILQWQQVTGGPAYAVDLSHAAVGTLDDGLAAWPGVERLTLSGFTYRAIAAGAPAGLDARLGWLRRPGDYHPDLYEQLAAAYRAAGQAGDARRVLIAKSVDWRKRGQFRSRQNDLPLGRRVAYALARAWSRFMWLTVGHGYRPWQALIPLVVLVATGSVLFQVAFDRGVIRPAQSAPEAAAECVAGYPCFHSLIYMLDVTVPVVEFHQQEYWAPSADVRGGAGYLWLVWLSTAVGWVLTAAVGGGTATALRRQ